MLYKQVRGPELGLCTLCTLGDVLQSCLAEQSCRMPYGHAASCGKAGPDAAEAHTFSSTSREGKPCALTCVLRRLRALPAAKNSCVGPHLQPHTVAASAAVTRSSKSGPQHPIWAAL